MASQRLKLLLLTITLFMMPPALAEKSPLRDILPYITKIKDQKGRNTCTIFTTIATLETLYARNGGSNKIDLSEEWLQYLASIANASGGAKGSMVRTDFSNAKRWGISSESVMPYTKGEWDGSERLARKMCGTESDHSSELQYTRCLYGKRPSFYLKASEAQLSALPGGREFSRARSNAQDFRSFVSELSIKQIYNSSVIKDYLDRSYPLTLEINVFHGSWNSSIAEKKGIGRDASQYRKGIIGYPEHGSKDRQISPKIGSRHSVQLVGYDDDHVIRYKLQMADGSYKTFTRKGVYIFKNSWGTSQFGKDFRYDRMRIPGFGMIPQDHVHEFGLVSVFR